MKKSLKIKDFRRYILNNWEGIKIYGEEACRRSCPEGHVSHVFSSRLSSRKPNKKVLAKVAKVFQNVTREKFNNMPILNTGKIIPLFNCLKGIQNGEYAF